MYAFILLVAISLNGHFVENTIQTRDSMNVREVVSWPFGPSYAMAEDPSRNLIFLGSGAGVFVLHLTNTGEYEMLSDDIKTSDGVVTSLVYDENREILIAGCEGMGLEVWSIQNPNTPVRVATYFISTITDPGRIPDMEVINEFLIAALSSYDTTFVAIFNLNNLTNFQPVSTISFPSATITDMDISGNSLFIQAGYTLEIYDISNLPNTNRIASFDDAGTPDGKIAVSDTILYLATGSMWGGWFSIYNISDLNNPQLITDVQHNFQNVYKIRFIHNRLYICGDALQSWNVTDPASPQLDWNYWLAGIYDFSNFQGHLISPAGRGGLTEIGFDTLGYSFEINSFHVPGLVNSLAAGDGYRYLLTWVARGKHRISVVSNGHRVGSIEFPSEYMSSSSILRYTSNYLYTANDTLFTAISVADPTHPVITSQIRTPVYSNYPRDFRVSDGFAYIVTDSGFVIVSTPDLRILSSISDSILTNFNKRILVDGNYMYIILNYDYKLVVIDISNPNSPTISAVLNIPPSGPPPAAIAKYGNYLYLSTQGPQIIIVDVSNPSNPQVVSTFTGSDWRISDLNYLTISGNYLIGARGSYSYIVLLDLTNPLTPQDAGYYDMRPIRNGSYPDLGLAAIGDTIIIGNGEIGIQEILLNPTLVGENHNYEQFHFPKVFLNGINFSLNVTEAVSLYLYDVSGKRIFTETKLFHPGNHRIEFSKVPNGLYLYKIVKGKKRYVGKVLILN